MDKYASKRTVVRKVKTRNSNEAIVADWYWGQHANELAVKETHKNLLEFMESTTEEYWDNEVLSDGECLDLAIELYDKGIAYL